MPERKYYKRKRRYNRRRRKYYKKRRNLAVSTMAPISKSLLTKLRYCETITLNPATGVPSYYTWSANNCYDPNVTGTGHQPLGFDQLMQLYDHFVVLGSKINCKFVSEAADADTGFAKVGISLDDDSVQNITNDTIREQPNTSWGLLSGINSRGVRSLSKKFSAKNFFNRKDVKDNTELSGSASAGPTEQAYFNCWVSPLTTGSNTGDIQLIVQIDYIVLLREPKQLTQS